MINHRVKFPGTFGKVRIPEIAEGFPARTLGLGKTKRKKKEGEGRSFFSRAEFKFALGDKTPAGEPGELLTKPDE